MNELPVCRPLRYPAVSVAACAPPQPASMTQPDAARDPQTAATVKKQLGPQTTAANGSVWILSFPVLTPLSHFSASSLSGSGLVLSKHTHCTALLPDCCMASLPDCCIASTPSSLPLHYSLPAFLAAIASLAAISAALAFTATFHCRFSLPRLSYITTLHSHITESHAPWRPPHFPSAPAFARLRMPVHGATFDC